MVVKLEVDKMKGRFKYIWKLLINYAYDVQLLFMYHGSYI